MGFEYRWTCPTIDKAASACKSDLESSITEILLDVCPLLDRELASKAAAEYASRMYTDCIEDFVEKVRSTNDDMRKEAERQIAILDQEISDLGQTISDLEGEVQALAEELAGEDL